MRGSDGRALAVGRAVQTVVSAICTEGVPTNPYKLNLAILEHARLAGTPDGATAPWVRGFRNEVATYAGVYLRRFLPGTGWTLHGTEVRLAKSRADLIWVRNRDGHVLVDEVKTGTDWINSVPVNEQALRHRDGAMQQWGDLVIGVRLLCLGSPQASQFYGTTSRRAIALDATEFASLGEVA